MRILKDAEGRDWQIDIDFTAIERVRAIADLDLLKCIEDDGVVRALRHDIEKQIHVLYALCKPEREERQLTEENFAKGFRGDVLQTASDMIFEELLDFFPPPKRGLLKNVLSKLANLERMLIARAERKIDAIDLEQLAKSSEKSFGTGQELSASTPAHSHSANSSQ